MKKFSGKDLIPIYLFFLLKTKVTFHILCISFHTMKVNSVCHSSIGLILLCRENVWIWNDMTVSKWWQNLHFCLDQINSLWADAKTFITFIMPWMPKCSCFLLPSNRFVKMDDLLFWRFLLLMGQNKVQTKPRSASLSQGSNTVWFLQQYWIRLKYLAHDLFLSMFDWSVCVLLVLQWCTLVGTLDLTRSFCDDF